MKDSFSAFLPFNKFEENPDGTLTVFGRATQEVRDSSNEVMDYATSVPFFKERSTENSIRSSGQNLMPLRSMHQNNAAGKVVQFDYLGDEKAIDIATLVVDPIDVLKVKTGVYTGFSVGGKYVRRWPEGGSMRYTADPREISLVDTPAVPTAKLTLFKVDLNKGEAEGHPFRGNQWIEGQRGMHGDRKVKILAGSEKDKVATRSWVQYEDNPDEDAIVDNAELTSGPTAADRIREFYMDEEGNINYEAAKELLNQGYSEQELIDATNEVEGEITDDLMADENYSRDALEARQRAIDKVLEFYLEEDEDGNSYINEDAAREGLAGFDEDQKQEIIDEANYTLEGEDEGGGEPPDNYEDSELRRGRGKAMADWEAENPDDGVFQETKTETKKPQKIGRRGKPPAKASGGMTIEPGDPDYNPVWDISFPEESHWSKATEDEESLQIKHSGQKKHQDVKRQAYSQILGAGYSKVSVKSKDIGTGRLAGLESTTLFRNKEGQEIEFYSNVIPGRNWAGYSQIRKPVSRKIDDVIHYEKVEWMDDFAEALKDAKKIKRNQIEIKSINLETLGERMGIQKRADSPLVPPKGFPNDPLEYGDPANYSYPVTKDLIVDTVERFNKGVEKYPQNERHTLGRRIVLLGNQFGEYVYIPELFKIESKEKIMSDALKKLDVGTIVAGLQGQAASSAALANSDPTAAVAQLLSYIDGLTTGQPISGQTVPVQDPSRALSKGVPPQFKAKVEEEPAEEESLEETSEVAEEEGEPTEAYLKLEAKVDALANSVTTLVDALTKRATAPAIQENPVGALNALVKNDPNLLEGLDETESRIIRVLDEGGPYALIKALEIASAGDPHGGGSMAWQKYNNAVRKASYLSLEKGGVITASRYVGRLY